MSNTNININLPKMDAYFKQHGNAKNADIKRLTNLLNNTWVKERWYILIIASALITYKVVKNEKRKDAKCEAEIKQNNIKEGEVVYEIN